jgi:hypothetical protein
MIETEDGYRFPSAHIPLIIMSGVLADMVEEQKRERNLVSLPVTVPIKGVRGDILEALVKLFYTGEVAHAFAPASRHSTVPEHIPCLLGVAAYYCLAKDV